jgi:hypothetical protein
MNPLAAVPMWAWVLALSIAGNAALGWAWLGARDKVATTTTERDNARAAASACSDATEALRELADKRGVEAKRAQAAARQAASQREGRAQQILSTPAALPGDDCGSARVRVDGWLKGRAAP